MLLQNMPEYNPLVSVYCKDLYYKVFYGGSAFAEGLNIK